MTNLPAVDPVDVTLVGGPLHNTVIPVERDAVKYCAHISGIDNCQAVYASNGADKAEFIFAGYTG